MSTDARFAAGELRLRVRHLIQAGDLPVMQPTELIAGYGLGDRCLVCDEPITHDQIEYDAGATSEGSRLIFHKGCHALWQLECTLLMMHNELTAQLGPDVGLSEELRPQFPDP